MIVYKVCLWINSHPAPATGFSWWIDESWWIPAVCAVPLKKRKVPSSNMKFYAKGSSCHGVTQSCLGLYYRKSRYFHRSSLYKCSIFPMFVVLRCSVCGSTGALAHQEFMAESTIPPFLRTWAAPTEMTSQWFEVKWLMLMLVVECFLSLIIFLRVIFNETPFFLLVD